MDTFRCGHSRSPENSAPNGKARPICRECRNARTRERYAADLEASRAAGRERQQKHRGGLKGHRNSRKEVCPQGHPYDEENTYLYKGVRQCKACRKVHVVKSWNKHHDKRLNDAREYYAKNRERLVAHSLQWAKNNPEKALLSSRLKKQRRRAAGILTAADWHSVLNKYGHKCLACASDGPLTIDHVVPVSRGGTNTVDNVQPLCGLCNSRKFTKIIDYRPAKAAV